jgi:hypothetical protein
MKIIPQINSKMKPLRDKLQISKFYKEKPLKN